MNQNHILYLECSSGISGDMTVGALLDLGADRQALEAGLASLPLSGYAIRISQVFKSGLRACDFHVILEQDNHDHDMEYLHGSETAHAVHHHHQEAETGHTVHSHKETSPSTSNQKKEEPHPHDGTASPHPHDARNLRGIIHILEHGSLTDGARRLAIRIFTILAEAEASVHGKTIDEVHFHEVGAVDSIVDIAAAAICIDSLHPDQIILSALTDGTGMIRCQHGLIPIPVPAVSAIAAAHKLPMRIRPIEGELVTPTGAAIAAALYTGAALPDEFHIVRTGLGAGKRDYAAAGVLRAMILEPAGNPAPRPILAQPAPLSSGLSRQSDSTRPAPLPPDPARQSGPAHPPAQADPESLILKLETNIDDCTGEALACTLELLMENGALDVYYTPIYMKKNRPAWMLSVLCTPAKRREMEAIIFRNTTTIGIRAQTMDRTRLGRQIITLQTPWGPADVKCCRIEDEIRYYPENDSVRRLAKQEQTGFGDMYRRIQECAVNQAGNTSLPLQL